MCQKSFITTFILFALFTFSSLAQVNFPIDELIKCYESKIGGCGALLEKSMAEAKEELGYEDYFKWLQDNGKIMADHGWFDASLTLAHVALQEAKTAHDRARIGQCYQRIGAVQLYYGKLDSSLYYNKLMLKQSALLHDSVKVGMAYINLGQTQKELGNYPEAFDNYTKAIRQFKALKNERYVARVYAEMASLSAVTGEVEKAINYNKKAAVFYNDDDDKHTYAYVITNLANDLIYTGREDTAEALLKIAIPIFADDGDIYLLMNAEAQLGRAKYHKEEFDSAITLFESSNNRAAEGSYLAQLAYNAEFLSLCYQALKNYEKAVLYARKSYEYNLQIGYNEEYGHALIELYSVYKMSHQPDSALKYLELYHEVKDSLFGNTRENQLNELKVKYETELKEERLNAQQADIDLLKVKAENQQIRMLALGVGILLILIIAIMVIRNQRVRISHQRSLAQKKEQLHKAEMDTQEARTERLRLQLENKKRELTNQALLIAEKNEMLRSFKEQLEDISERMEENTAMNGLVRKIERAETKTEDWDKFMHIFEDVHPAFIKIMHTKFGNLTANDIRLSALLRMNFSSKEISNILHISADGLKKARYRLRKKLALPSDENLQEYIVKL